MFQCTMWMSQWDIWIQQFCVCVCLNQQPNEENSLSRNAAYSCCAYYHHDGSQIHASKKASKYAEIVKDIPIATKATNAQQTTAQWKKTNVRAKQKTTTTTTTSRNMKICLFSVLFFFSRRQRLSLWLFTREKEEQNQNMHKRAKQHRAMQMQRSKHVAIKNATHTHTCTRNNRRMNHIAHKMVFFAAMCTWNAGRLHMQTIMPLMKVWMHFSLSILHCDPCYLSIAVTLSFVLYTFCCSP